MATSGWFVEPDTVRKELSDGQWIEIKTRLTYGEQKRLETGAMGKLSGNTEEDAGISLDFERYNIMRMATWLVDWSATGLDGKRGKVTKDAIAALNQDIAQEIDDVLTAHIEELEASKNAETPLSE
jgi:hypothetical protein